MTDLHAFASYAHHDRRLATVLMESLEQRLRLHPKLGHANLWRDSDILVGDAWDATIRTAMTTAGVGFLLLSPSFFDRRYIVDVELPALLGDPTRLIVPVGLVRFDLATVDTLGIEARQIFGYRKPTWNEPRWFDELGSQLNRNAFVEDLVRQVIEQLERRGRL